MVHTRNSGLHTTLAMALMCSPLAVVAQQPAPRGMMSDNDLGPNAGRTPAILGPRAATTPSTTQPPQRTQPGATQQPGTSPGVPPQRTTSVPSSAGTPRLDEPIRPGKNPSDPAPRIGAPVPQDVVDRVTRLVEQGNFQMALNLVDTTIRERGESSPLLVLRARVLCSVNRFDDCLRTANRSIELDPQSADARLFRGRVFGFNAPRTEGNRQSALQDFAEAQRLAPNSAAPIFFTGLFHLEIGNDLNQAIALFDQALVLEPNHRRAHVSKSTALLTHGQHDNAFVAAEVAIRQVPNAPEPLAVRGMVHLARGDQAAASRDLKAAESLSRTFEVYTSLGLTALAASRAFSNNGSIVSSGRR